MPHLTSHHMTSTFHRVSNTRISIPPHNLPVMVAECRLRIHGCLWSGEGGLEAISCFSRLAQVTARLAENQRLLAQQVQWRNELLELERAMPRRQDANNFRHAWHPQTRKLQILAGPGLRCVAEFDGEVRPG